MKIAPGACQNTSPLTIITNKHVPPVLGSVMIDHLHTDGARAAGLLQVSADGEAVVLENENGQPHHHRSEHRVVEVDGEQYFLRQGESTFIRGGVKHRLSNPGKIGGISLRFSSGVSGRG
jgi:mannose-6-phosphate isomerase-like protein (cupin superfamily)